MIQTTWNLSPLKAQRQLQHTPGMHRTCPWDMAKDAPLKNQSSPVTPREIFQQVPLSERSSSSLSSANNHTSSLTGQLMIPISGILANSMSPSTSIFLVLSSNVRSATCKALLQVRKMADDNNTQTTHSVASGCPTQRCLPRPNPMCIAMLGRCSTNSWGFSNTVGSRLAAL